MARVVVVVVVVVVNFAMYVDSVFERLHILHYTRVASKAKHANKRKSWMR